MRMRVQTQPLLSYMDVLGKSCKIRKAFPHGKDEVVTATAVNTLVLLRRCHEGSLTSSTILCCFFPYFPVLLADIQYSFDMQVVLT